MGSAMHDRLASLGLPAYSNPLASVGDHRDRKVWAEHTICPLPGLCVATCAGDDVVLCHDLWHLRGVAD